MEISKIKGRIFDIWSTFHWLFIRNNNETGFLMPMIAKKKPTSILYGFKDLNMKVKTLKICRKIQEKILSPKLGRRKSKFANHKVKD